MSDNKSQSNDNDMSSTPGHTAVNATISFDLTDYDGERRLREMLDASRVKAVLWELDQWLRGFIKYGTEGTELSGIDPYGVVLRVRKKLWALCDDHGIRLDEE